MVILRVSDPLTMNGLDFGNRVTVVTGGGTGIGAATAKLLARLGADVVIASRSEEKLEQSAAPFAMQPASAVGDPNHVKDEEQVRQLVQKTVDSFGRIDVLINNAGGTDMLPLEKITAKRWDGSFALNVTSAYYCTREAGRHFMAQRSGAIVNISSTAGISGVKGGAHYSSAKAALQMFTRVTAAEWGRLRHPVQLRCPRHDRLRTRQAGVEKANIEMDSLDDACSAAPCR